MTKQRLETALGAITYHLYDNLGVSKRFFSRGHFWELLKGGYIPRGREEYILWASHSIIVVKRGGRFWEGGVDSEKVTFSCWKWGCILGVSHIYIFKKGGIFWEGGVYSGRVAYTCWNGLHLSPTLLGAKLLYVLYNNLLEHYMPHFLTLWRLEYRMFYRVLTL